ncbi:MAG: rRNA pseudouridine synthase [Candidatus Pacebacteria bacterium]|nr:rRNA pseudouridine synthase [Candidatus Paceibacterota bacterium]
MKKERLQKFIAHSGFCSRRKADELIGNGRGVYVNGKLAVLGMKVDEHDEVKIGGKIIGSEKKKVYIKMNKPTGYTCTTKSFKDEKNVYSLLPQKVWKNMSLHIVGRLDKDSQGLVLLTNDGDLTQELTHPSYEHEKKYIVTLRKDQARNVRRILKVFVDGMDIEDIGQVRAKRIKHVGDDTFEVVLTEGKKRQVRMMFRELDEHVVYLQRVSLGKLKLGNLASGKWMYLTEKEVEELKK